MSETVPIYGFGGGGAALNFDVKQYTTESQLSAAKPKENTIGVITTTAITNWHFAAEQPGNMVNGDVWFHTGTSSTVAFNALKKNNVTVYPLGLKQYVNGALVDVSGKIYQAGIWKDFETVLYDSGRFADGFDVDAKSDSGSASVTKNADSMTWEGRGNAWHIFYITPKILPSGHKTLKMLVENASGSMDSNSGKFGIASSVDSPDDVEFPTGYQAFSKFSGQKIFAFDLTAITGSTEYYVALHFGTTNSTFSFDVKKIWLE